MVLGPLRRTHSLEWTPSVLGSFGITAIRSARALDLPLLVRGSFAAGRSQRPLILAWFVVVYFPVFFTCCSVEMEALGEMVGTECKKFCWEEKKKFSISCTVEAKDTIIPSVLLIRGEWHSSQKP